jgi:hypothetical protein
LTETTPPPGRKVGVAAAHVQIVPTGAVKGRRGRLCAASKHPGHPEQSGWLVWFFQEIEKQRTTMKIKFKCSGCRRVLNATSNDIGNSALCPGCGTALVVPMPGLGQGKFAILFFVNVLVFVFLQGQTGGLGSDNASILCIPVMLGSACVSGYLLLQRLINIA